MTNEPMSEPPRPDTSSETCATVANSSATTIANATVASTLSSAPPTTNQLTPEEQLALFAKELKEDDWGHQPC